MSETFPLSLYTSLILCTKYGEYYEVEMPASGTAAQLTTDFYLPYSGLKAVAAATPDNALLQGRGLPGTHDIPLLSSVLSSIRSGQAVDLPSFDKSAHSGFGDRGSPTQLSEPLDLFLLEGWCINTSPAETSLLAERHPTAPISSRHPFASLEQINEGFRELEAVLDKKVDRRVTLDAPREWVYEWRIEQEEKLIQERGSGMTEDEVRAFVDRYMPVYECWDASGDVRVQLDKNRQIVSIRES